MCTKTLWKSRGYALYCKMRNIMIYLVEFTCKEAYPTHNGVALTNSEHSISFFSRIFFLKNSTVNFPKLYSPRSVQNWCRHARRCPGTLRSEDRGNSSKEGDFKNSRCLFASKPLYTYKEIFTFSFFHGRWLQSLGRWKPRGFWSQNNARKVFIISPRNHLSMHSVLQLPQRAGPSENTQRVRTSDEISDTSAGIRAADWRVWKQMCCCHCFLLKMTEPTGTGCASMDI